MDSVCGATFAQEQIMKRYQTALLASLVALAAGTAAAQPDSGRGPGAGPGPGASAPGGGMGPRMGPGMGRGAGRWGSDFTPGWAMMTPEERNEHRDRMRNMKSYEECKAYQSQHHEQMAARAKERGGSPMPGPRRDACAGMKR
jgi:hypothetical protein